MSSIKTFSDNLRVVEKWVGRLSAVTFSISIILLTYSIFI